MPRRIGILGGTFDPVHNAHLAIARLALDRLALDRLLWIPTGAPRYRAPALAPGPDRVAMLRLALGDDRRQVVDERELAPGASGYTIDTVESLRAEHPGASFVLLMGADQHERFATWHRHEALAALCEIAVVARPGSRLSGQPATLLEMPSMPVSSCELRGRIARGEDVSRDVPPAVARYILEKGLYR